jgi:hypothetical protein
MTGQRFMMATDFDLDTVIAHKLRSEHEIKMAEHVRSGKLSASQLSKPLLEQVLKIIGVPEKPIEDYTLRLFKRGNQVEDWIVSMLPDGEEQKEVDYKGVVGYIDKLLDVPVEVKSIKSSQWRWLQKEGARWSHKLQAGLYALGVEADSYKVLYVVADDFRTFTYTGQTADIKPEIDEIINEVKRQLIRGELPAFVPRESWQSKDTYSKYSPFPEFINLEPELAMKKLQNTYPDAYKKLKAFKNKAKEAVK